ncbi:MAG: hypothetical protein ACLRVT_06790 [Oscillospiraceae bacterium]
MKHASAQIRQMVLNAFGAAVGQGIVPPVPLRDFKTEFPRHNPEGSMRCDAAVLNAGTLQWKPRELAEVICRFLVFDEEYPGHCRIDETGMLWFSLRPQWYTGVLSDILACQSAYGRSLYGRGKKLLVEVESGLDSGSALTAQRTALTAQVLSEVYARSGYCVSRRLGRIPGGEEPLDLRQAELVGNFGFVPHGEPLNKRVCWEVLELLAKLGLARQREGNWCYENGKDCCRLEGNGRPTRFLWVLASCYEAIAGQGYEEILRVCSGCREEETRMLERAVKALCGAKLRVCLVSPMVESGQADFGEAVRLLCCDAGPQTAVHIRPEEVQEYSAFLVRVRALLSGRSEGDPVQESPVQWASRSQGERQLICKLALFSNCLLEVLTFNNPALLVQYLRELAELAGRNKLSAPFDPCVAVTIGVALQILGIEE